jgi:DNA repair protein RecO (recombination protein O)
MLRSTKAVVIHTFPYSDSSVILRSYTEQKGFTSFILKGFKKNKKQKALLYPLAIVELSFVEKGNTSLYFARSIHTQNPHSNILLDPLKSGVAMFLSEWLSHTIKDDEEGEQSFFAWLVNAIELLNEIDSSANFHLWFLVELSRYLGFGPQGQITPKTPLFSISEGCFIPRGSNTDCLSEKESVLFNKLMRGSFEEIIGYSMRKDERSNLLHLLHKYYQIHLGKEFNLKSLEVLKQLYD